MTTKPQTWLITGCSSGFGIALARIALARGHNVIASSRNPTKNQDLVSEIESNPQGRWIKLDVTWPLEEIKGTITKASSLFPDGIDVLVNNAGYPILGAVEDIPENLAKQQFDTLFWGPVRLIKAVLPQMRDRKSGIIVNMSSVAGLKSPASASMYAASKHALESLSESLSVEVAPFNIRVLIVEPGNFRTNLLGANASVEVPPSEAYKTGPVADVMQFFAKMDNQQRGDPIKAAERIVDVVIGEGLGAGKQSLIRLPLGEDCYDRVIEYLHSVEGNFEQMREIALSTDF